ncbi:2Fe-2S iron-sulfur cluster-binding protein [Streptomyces sp. NPDC059761]|uniref:2Fe-2S iron-sulfur cluster-binding protein n=1 Tax=Streptomyces sp. NPDC059761 TaxID=3346937 RepID=UPI00365DBD53
MSYQVALNFEDGVTQIIGCPPDETVASTSHKVRIDIPFDCRDGACGACGTCGTCKSMCGSGRYDGGDCIDGALTEGEAALGHCLPCQMTPQSDLIPRTPSSSAAPKTTATGHTATVASVKRHASATVEFTLAIDERNTLAFLPGRYVDVVIPGTDEARPYSFGSGPTRQQLSFLVRVADGAARPGGSPGALPLPLRPNGRGPGPRLTSTTSTQSCPSPVENSAEHRLVPSRTRYRIPPARLPLSTGPAEADPYAHTTGAPR